jgi:uncharacterized protein (UPF0276 family)
MGSAKPLVGLLYNPAVPAVLDAAGTLVDHIEVIPDRLWYDFGVGAPYRFSHAHAAIAELRHYAERHAVIGHGIGLSLPSAMPIDQALLDEVAASHRQFGYRWYSEHLSMFLAPGGTVPNAQAGMGLPVVHSDETLDIVADKLALMRDALGVDLALENGTIFSAIPDPDMSEPEFMNRLHALTGCKMLLDLHNLYANTLNLGWSVDDYLGALDPEIVLEIHLAGGDKLKEHHTDSHSQRTPAPVWEWLATWGPRFPNLAAITFEYHESYHRRIGLDGIVAELEAMHAAADAIASTREAVPA